MPAASVAVYMHAALIEGGGGAEAIGTVEMSTGVSVLVVANAAHASMAARGGLLRARARPDRKGELPDVAAAADGNAGGCTASEAGAMSPSSS